MRFSYLMRIYSCLLSIQLCIMTIKKKRYINETYCNKYPSNQIADANGDQIACVHVIFKQALQHGISHDFNHVILHNRNHCVVGTTKCSKELIQFYLSYETGSVRIQVSCKHFIIEKKTMTSIKYYIKDHLKTQCGWLVQRQNIKGLPQNSSVMQLSLLSKQEDELMLQKQTFIQTFIRHL